MGSDALPIPPVEMRTLVGPIDISLYDNPTGALVYQDIEPDAYEAVFDFGCGCGRVARQLIQQNPRPRRYMGIDLHRGMIEWCRNNLKPHAPQFEFRHHDVFNAGLNPGHSKPMMLPFPLEDHAFTLVIAWSVFTHLIESQAEFYLSEVARVLRPNGVLLSTWFLFDKTDFPMMQEFQNALYINDVEPSNAVIFDRTWLRRTASKNGLTIYSVRPPEIRGFQWVIMMTPRRDGVIEVGFPPDEGPVGIARPPLMPPHAEEIGMGENEQHSNACTPGDGSDR